MHCDGNCTCCRLRRIEESQARTEAAIAAIKASLDDQAGMKKLAEAVVAEQAKLAQSLANAPK